MKNSAVKLSIYVISALIGFSLILCLAVFGVLACSSDRAAFAESPSNTSLPYYATGTFSQNIHSYDGIDFEVNDSQNNSIISIGSYGCYSLYENLNYPNTGTIYPLCQFIQGHLYVICCTFYMYDGDQDFTLHFPVNNWYGERAQVGWTSGYRTYNFFHSTYVTDTVDYFYISTDSRYMSMSDLMVIDITDIQYGFNSPAIQANPATTPDWFYYYFGRNYIGYTEEYDVEFAHTATFDGYWENGFEEGLSDGYSNGYSDGYRDGTESFDPEAVYSSGYDAGYANGLLEISSNTFVSDRTTWSDYDSLLPFIDMNGTVVYNNPLWSVGYEDMFVFGSMDPTVYAYSFNYTMGSYNGSVNTVVSSNYYTFGEDPQTQEKYIAVTLENDYVQFSLVMFAHRSYLTLNIVDTNGTSFLPLNYSDLYKVTVFRNNDSNTIFQAGVEFADSRVNETSVSYNTGFSRGVNDAQKYTFYTLIDSVIFSPISMIQRALNFNILGMNMRDFFMSLFTIAVVLYLVRLFLGASGGGE